MDHQFRFLIDSYFLAYHFFKFNRWRRDGGEDDICGWEFEPARASYLERVRFPISLYFLFFLGFRVKLWQELAYATWTATFPMQ